MRKLAIQLGLPEERQSPIAIGRGQQVERHVLGDKAKILIERLLKDGKVAPSVEVLDLSKRAPNRAGMQKAARDTDRCINDLLHGRSVPALIIHAVLSVP